jgi:uncharacterized membrane protein
VNVWALGVTAFLASAVEAVEAATIVLAVGYVQGWKTALRGAVAASLALVAIVGIGGPALLLLVPIGVIRAVVGAFLIWFGYGWVRKAVLRYAGRIPLHDETKIFERERSALGSSGAERLGFVTAFKGVFLEGLEVAIIVVTVGSASRAALSAAAAGAAAACAAVVCAGILVRRPFARVPENTMKFVVGIMLVSFGTFWLGEGLGVAWFLGDATLLVLAAGYAALALVVSLVLRFR